MYSAGNLAGQRQGWIEASPRKGQEPDAPPYLGGYAAAHRVTLARELPVYIDRGQPDTEFIWDVLAANPHTPAVLKVNGGPTFFGPDLLQSA